MTETNSTDQAAPEPFDPTQCSGEEGVCPEHGFHRQALKQPAATIADAFEVPLHLIDTTQPVEHCGHQLPPMVGNRPFTECVLRPGHQGSHANHEGARWIERPAAGYCPHCGRGDAGPTADDYAASQRRAVLFATRIGNAREWARRNLPAQQADQLFMVLRGDLPTRDHPTELNPPEPVEHTRDRARRDAIASRESERILQQQIDRQAKEIDRLRDKLAGRPADSCGSCGARPVTYYAIDGHPACADCAPCDCGTEPCSKPDIVAARNAALEPPKEKP